MRAKGLKFKEKDRSRVSFSEKLKRLVDHGEIGYNLAGKLKACRVRVRMIHSGQNYYYELGAWTLPGKSEAALMIHPNNSFSGGKIYKGYEEISMALGVPILKVEEIYLRLELASIPWPGEVDNIVNNFI